MNKNGNKISEEEEEEFLSINEEQEKISLEEQRENNKKTRIGNKIYDEDTLNRITIVRLTQVGIKPKEIKAMLNISKSMLYKWVNYEKMKPKKMGRPPKFQELHKDFIYKTSEGKLTVSNKVSSRNIAAKFSSEFNKSISYSYVCKLLLKKYGRPYRGINSILLKEDHIKQRLAFVEEIMEKKINSSNIMFTDECRIILFPKVNPKINVIRLNDQDKKNIHSFEVNKKRTFFKTKFEISLMVAGGISKVGLSNLVFCSGTMNNFSYKQFLLFIKEDIEQLKEKYNLNFLLFQQDNASCHKSRDSLEAIEVLFGKDKIWWPANSPDLSPIETVWAIIKQELSKKKISTLDELRNNVIDIWSKFPDELCEKIISEFDEKIQICKKENGNLINKKMLKKFRGNENKIKIEYDWEKVKRDKSIRIVYSDKTISIMKAKLIKKIKSILNEKIKEFKKDNPKLTKYDKLLAGQNYKDVNKGIKKKLNQIIDCYEIIIKYIKRTKPIDFITKFMNNNLINDKKYLLNTQFSKKIQINANFIMKLFNDYYKENLKGENTLEDEINFEIESIEKKAKINSIKKYLPNEIAIDPFPEEQKKYRNNTIENEIFEDEISDETHTYKDSIEKMKELNLNIKEFRKKNKSVIEKDKKIMIKQVNEIENDGDDEKSDEDSENEEKDEENSVEENEENNEILSGVSSYED